MLRKFAEPAGSSLLRPYRVYSPVGAYFQALQVSRAYWLVPFAILSGLLTRASLLSCFARLPTLLARAFATWPGLLTRASFVSCFASSPSLLAYLQSRRVSSPMRVYIHASEFHRAYSLVLLATLQGLLTRASLLSFIGSSPSLLARTSCDLARYAHPCEFTFMLRKLAESAVSCFLPLCRVRSP
ncbi:hypothetical protein CRG98_049842, partial [Punica granatum]